MVGMYYSLYIYTCMYVSPPPSYFEEIIVNHNMSSSFALLFFFSPFTPVRFLTYIAPKNDDDDMGTKIFH